MSLPRNLFIVCLVSAAFGQSLVFPSSDEKSWAGKDRCVGQLDKLSLNQSGYVQYTEFDTNVPRLRAFTVCYWMNVRDTTRGATPLNYALDEDANTDNLTVTYEGNGRWRTTANGQVLYRLKTAPLPEGRWSHQCQSWDGRADGRWAVWQDGRLAGHGNAFQSSGVVVPGGGVLVTGQHQNTISAGGMDRGEGLVGEITLVQVWSRALLAAPSKPARKLAYRLANDCDSANGGDLVTWRSTPRRGYGGVTRRVARQHCGRF